MSSSVFDNREKGEETHYSLIEEQHFKAQAKRDKMLGLWVAEKMGLQGEEAKAYAQAVIVSDLEEPGDEDVIRKVMADINEQNLGITEDELRMEMARFMALALEEQSKG